MNWSEILRIPAVRRKFAMNFALILVYSLLTTGLFFLGWRSGGTTIGIMLALAGFFAFAVWFQIVVPPLALLQPFRRWHVSRRDRSPAYWDVAERGAAKLRLRRPELYEFRGIGAGAVGWDFTWDKGIAVELAITRETDAPSLLESVVAHELAHHKNNDRKFTLIVQNLAALTTFSCTILAVSSIFKVFLGRDSAFDAVALVTAGTIYIFNRFMYGRLLMRMLHLQEFAADALGAAVTGKPIEAAAALLAVELRAQTIRQMLILTGQIISDPKDAEFRTHPSTEERVLALVGNRRS